MDYNPHVLQLLCPFCESAEENEIHFIFACRTYDDKNKIKTNPLNLLKRNPAVYNLADLLQRENVLNLAKFIAERLKRRQDMTESKLPSEN